MEKIVSSVTKRAMITTQSLLNQGKAGSGQEPTNMQRRTLMAGRWPLSFRLLDR